jgi:tetratricopeptide (TPR) repeat protein
MRRMLLTAALALGVTAFASAQQQGSASAQQQGSASAQQQGSTSAQQQGSASAQPGPKVKSQKELQALQAVQSATDPNQRLTAIENVLENFTDTEYKPLLLDMAIQTAQQINDPAKVEVYSERALKENPKDVSAQLALATTTLQGTKEFDLDKEQKLAKVDKYANGAIDSLKTAPSPNPQLTDAQWQEAKKQMTAEAYAALGGAAALRKKFDVAITNYKTAADADPQPAVLVRLADAYSQGNQPDAAISTCDRVLAMSDAQPQVKQVAEQVKARAQKAKSGAK